jgi:hypothetical protein
MPQRDLIDSLRDDLADAILGAVRECQLRDQLTTALSRTLTSAGVELFSEDDALPEWARGLRFTPLPEPHDTFSERRRRTEHLRVACDGCVCPDCADRRQCR